MPKPAGKNQRYMPGLDGLRAIAVLAVIGYHVRIGWMPGGLLGVGVFFTLSGYLITDLLLQHKEDFGSLGLSSFWVRRARRLLPALFVMLGAVTIWVALLDRERLTALRGSVIAAIFYVSNWFYIGQHMSYFGEFARPTPLDHLWSLAVEEQFYLVWPFLLLIGLMFIRRRSWLVVTVVVLAAISTVLMAVLYQPGFDIVSRDPTRVYEGTDTRAAGLLIGAILAMVWPSTRLAKLRLTRRQLLGLETTGALGLVVIGLLFVQSTEFSLWLYRGGFLLLSLATAAVVAAAVHPATWTGRLLGIGPLRWLGVRSYGIYLWHYPIIILASAWWGFAQVFAAVALAALSWHFIEEPIRRGALGAFWSHIRARRYEVVPRRSWGALTTGVAVVVVAGCSLSSASGGKPAGAAGPTPPPILPTPKGTMPAMLPWGPLPEPQTSCRSVVYIGDSTSEGMILPDYLPDPKLRLGNQLRRVGIKVPRIQISGARSIVETLSGQQNGYTVAKNLKTAGFHGCWFIALGTNDTANVAVANGSAMSRAARIKEMMSVIGEKQPVLWTTVKTLPGVADPAYAESNMKLWNRALMKACPKYKNMKVFNWASLAKPSWFIYDDTHYTSTGYMHRAHLSALGLAHAFPGHGKSTFSGCLGT